MAAFLLRRLVLTIPVVWIVVTLVFALIHLVPGDPVAQMLGEALHSPEIERCATIWVWTGRFSNSTRPMFSVCSKGTWELSFRTQQPVAQSIAARYPATIQLTFAAIVVSLVLAIPAGVIAAVKRGKLMDSAIGVFSLLGVSLPNFALGPLLILLFSVFLGVVAGIGPGGNFPFDSSGSNDGGALAAITTRMVRASMLEEIQQDYVRTARAKGLPERVVFCFGMPCEMGCSP